WTKWCKSTLVGYGQDDTGNRRPKGPDRTIVSSITGRIELCVYHSEDALLALLGNVGNGPISDPGRSWRGTNLETTPGSQLTYSKADHSARRGKPGANAPGLAGCARHACPVGTRLKVPRPQSPPVKPRKGGISEVAVPTARGQAPTIDFLIGTKS